MCTQPQGTGDCCASQRALCVGQVGIGLTVLLPGYSTLLPCSSHVRKLRYAYAGSNGTHVYGASEYSKDKSYMLLLIIGDLWLFSLRPRMLSDTNSSGPCCTLMPSREGVL